MKMKHKNKIKLKLYFNSIPNLISYLKEPISAIRKKNQIKIKLTFQHYIFKAIWLAKMLNSDIWLVLLRCAKHGLLTPLRTLRRYLMTACSLQTFISIIERTWTRPYGRMDKASEYESSDSRFEAGLTFFFTFYIF